MNLILDIAWTHVRSRARQTLVAVAGVATGVGFSVMMASLMVGSQNDFMKQLIDALRDVAHEQVNQLPQVGISAKTGIQRLRRRNRALDHGGLKLPCALHFKHRLRVPN